MKELKKKLRKNDDMKHVAWSRPQMLTSTNQNQQTDVFHSQNINSNL